eukprot:TRINITY_DN12962_c0_g1_i1.p1 TRINITY_DN12962_c0_g1~~TRINITY_DN12962_c0_g1_i1.p1  ORF type:complete len:341 (-),score=127.46 TRINITY_DN12962_c0_g1_i1:63-1085(-)
MFSTRALSAASMTRARGQMNFRPASESSFQMRYFANRPGETNTGAKYGAPSATPDGSSVRLDRESTTRTKPYDENDIIQGDLNKTGEKIKETAADAKDYVQSKASQAGLGSVEDMKKTAANAADTAKKTVANAAQSAKQFVEDKIGQDPTHKVANMAQDAKDYATEKVHEMKASAASAARSVGGKVLDAKDSVSQSAEHLKHEAQSAARNATAGSNTTSSYTEVVKDAVSSVAGTAQGVAAAAAQKVSEMTGGSAEKVLDSAKQAVGNATNAAKSAFNSVAGDVFTKEEPMRPGKDDPSKFDHGKTGAEASNPNVARADELYVENEKKKTGKKDNNPNHI